MDYLVRFIGHIDEHRRPVDFPKEIYSDLYVRVKDDQELKAAINEQSKTFILQQCMVVPKEPGAIEEMHKARFDTRMMVMLNMLTHIDTITKKITGEIPEVGKDGTPQLMDGTKVDLQ
jgi:hypothetical protein